MCKFIGKSNERILCKLSKSEILRLYSIVHVAMETTKTSNFNRPSKSFISIFFTWQVSACELQPFSCYDLANEIYFQTAKIVFSHLKREFERGASKLQVQHSSHSMIVQLEQKFISITWMKTLPPWQTVQSKFPRKKDKQTFNFLRGPLK